MSQSAATPTSLKVDRTRLKTPKNYADLRKVSLQTVYNWMAENKVQVEDIDGVKFVRI